MISVLEDADGGGNKPGGCGHGNRQKKAREIVAAQSVERLATSGVSRRRTFANPSAPKVWKRSLATLRK